MRSLADAAIGATPRYVTVYDFQPMQRALVDEALAHVGSDGRRLAWLLCCASAGRYYEEPGDKPYAVRALALARESDDPEIRATGLLTYHRWLTHDPRAADERLALSRELLLICQTERLDALAGRASRTYLIDLLGLACLDDFDRELETLAEFADRNRAPGRHLLGERVPGDPPAHDRSVGRGRGARAGGPPDRPRAPAGRC